MCPSSDSTLILKLKKRLKKLHYHRRRGIKSRIAVRTPYRNANVEINMDLLTGVRTHRQQKRLSRFDDCFNDLLSEFSKRKFCRSKDT